MTKTEEVKKEIVEKLEELKTEKKEMEKLIEQLEGVVELKEKKVKPSYGTSCVQIRNKSGELLTEW